jgi:4-hydroxybenzoate polyprenyltransferase
LPYAVAFAALPSSIAISKGITPPVWMLLGGSIFGMAAHFINVIKDMEQDQVSGIQGLPQRLGAGKSVIIAITLIASGVLVIYLTA